MAPHCDKVGQRGKQSGCQPGTKTMLAVYNFAFPGTGTLGCYNPSSRTQSGKPSYHTEGRAVDVYIPPNSQALGDAVFNYSIGAADAWGLIEIIWDSRIWSCSNPSVRPFADGGAHRNHVHLGQNWDGADSKTSAYRTPGPAPTSPAPGPWTPGGDMPAPRDIVDAIWFGGGKVLLQYDGGTQFTGGAGWPHGGPFSYPGLPDNLKKLPGAFAAILNNTRGGFDLVHVSGAVYSFPI